MVRVHGMESFQPRLQNAYLERSCPSPVLPPAASTMSSARLPCHKTTTRKYSRTLDSLSLEPASVRLGKPAKNDAWMLNGGREREPPRAKFKDKRMLYIFANAISGEEVARIRRLPPYYLKLDDFAADLHMEEYAAVLGCDRVPLEDLVLSSVGKNEVVVRIVKLPRVVIANALEGMRYTYNFRKFYKEFRFFALEMPLSGPETFKGVDVRLLAPLILQAHVAGEDLTAGRCSGFFGIGTRDLCADDLNKRWTRPNTITNCYAPV